MKILAFMQCMWIKPESMPAVRRMFARCGNTPEGRCEGIARLLFFRCLSGKRLKAAFGDLCDKIIWEEVSTEIGDNPSAVFPPDLEHMKSCIAHFKPDLVIAFGKISATALPAVWAGPSVVTCHPAARQNAPQLLADAAKRVRDIMAAAVPQTQE